MTAASSPRTWTWRSSLPTLTASRRGAPRRASAASCAGLGISNTIERAGAPSYEGAEIRFDRSGTVTLFCGAVNQGQGHETVFKQIMCDRLGLDPADIQYLQGDTDQVFFGEGTGGSRSATLGGSAVDAAAHKVIEKARAIAAFALKVDAAKVKFADGVFSTPATNQTLTIKEVARLAANPAKLPPGMEPGLVVTAVYRGEVENFPNGGHVCELEIDRDTGEVEILRYSVVDDVGTVLNPLLLHGQIAGGIAQGVGQILCEDIRFDPRLGRAPDRIVHGLRHAARERSHRRRHQEQSGADQDQSARRQGRRRSRHRRRHAGGRQRAGRRAVRVRRPPHRDAGDAGGDLARHGGREGGVSGAGGGGRGERCGQGWGDALISFGNRKLVRFANFAHGLGGRLR